jgi:hypothetical protein
VHILSVSALLASSTKLTTASFRSINGLGRGGDATPSSPSWPDPTRLGALQPLGPHRSGKGADPGWERSLNKGKIWQWPEPGDPVASGLKDVFAGEFLGEPGKGKPSSR